MILLKERMIIINKSYKITISVSGDDNLEVETKRITKRKMNKIITGIINYAYSLGCSIINISVEVLEE